MPKVPTKVPPMLEPYTEEKPKKIKYQPINKTSKKLNGGKSKPTTAKSAEPPVAAKQSKQGKAKLLVTDRVVIYDEIAMRLYDDQKPLTPDEAKEILGWQEESENIKFLTENGGYLFKDERGLKIRCTNNITNRPIRWPIVAALKQEILHRRWRLNGETIIVGRTGLVLNGQHTLVALIFAHQTWMEKQGQYQHVWPDTPYIEKVAVFGIDETDDTVNTIDTTKPRDLGDVIFRSEYFRDQPEKNRRKLSRIAQHAVMMLWHRTGASENAFSAGATRQTHAESLNFIARHPRLLECVKHIFEEDGDKSKFKRILSPGYASALLYLMGSSATDSSGDDKDGYAYAEPPDESHLDWEHWDKAQSFWVQLAAGDKTLLAVKAAIAQSMDPEHGCGGTRHERLGILVKAWRNFLDGKSVTPKSLELEYLPDEDEAMVLVDHPIVGGIDIGQPTKD